MVNERNDALIDLERIEALARTAGLSVEEFLQAATAAHARRRTDQRPASELYQRIRYAGGLRRLVESFYPRVLADPLLMGYFKHLNDRELQWLRWHMLTLLVTVTGGPTRYEGRDLHEAHADLHITGEAFDRVAWHLQQALKGLQVHPGDQQAILAQFNARRGEVVTFEDPF